LVAVADEKQVENYKFLSVEILWLKLF